MKQLWSMKNKISILLTDDELNKIKFLSEISKTNMSKYIRNNINRDYDIIQKEKK